MTMLIFQLNELMQQNIQPVEFEGSLPLQDISENVDVFVFDVPINVSFKVLIKITFELFWKI